MTLIKTVKDFALSVLNVIKVKTLVMKYRYNNSRKGFTFYWIIIILYNSLHNFIVAAATHGVNDFVPCYNSTKM